MSFQDITFTCDRDMGQKTLTHCSTNCELFGTCSTVSMLQFQLERMNDVRTNIRLAALELVDNERESQIRLWGDKYFPDLPIAMLCLGEEFGELSEAVQETVYNLKPEKAYLGGTDRMLLEATHVAAVAVKIIEMLLTARG